MKDGYKYMLRFVLVPGLEEDERIKELVRFCKDTLIDEVVFFICAEDYNTGHVTIEEATPFVNAILKAKSKLQPLGIKTSINPWITLNHSDRGRSLKPGQNFDTMVGVSGYKAKTVACPLSEGWRKYYREYIKFICDTVNPDTVWIEDDLRFSNHELEGEDMGCFCDEHLKLFAKHLGLESISRENFVKGLYENKKGYRQAYTQINEQVIKEFLTELREYINHPEVRLGTMAGAPAAKYFEGGSVNMMMNTLKSSQRDSIFRAHVAFYRQHGAQTLAFRFNRYIAQGRAFLDEDADIVSEIENYPCTRYCKSAKFTAFSMLMTAPLLMQGATFSLFEYCGNGVYEGEKFTKELVAVKDYLALINNLHLKHSNTSGICAYLNKDANLYINDVKWLSCLEYQDNFLGGVMSTMGVSVTYASELEKTKDVVILSALAISSLTDQKIKELLDTHYIMISALGVEKMIERGLGELIGVSNIERLKERTGQYSYEEECEQLGPKKRERAAMQFFVGDYGKITYSGKFTPVTKVYNYDGSLVGNGITLVNDKVIIFPIYATEDSLDQGYPCGLLHPMRRNAIKNIVVDKLKIKDVAFSDSDMVVPYLYKKDGKDYLTLNNYLEDQVDKIEFSCSNEYKKIRIATVAQPKFREVSFERDGSKYVLDVGIGSSTSVTIELE